MKTILVASQNPVKIQAVRDGFERMFPLGHFSVKGVSVPSGVSDQPMSAQETYQGAWNRVQAAKASGAADFWVGIEGGVEEIDGALYTFAWVLVLGTDAQGKSRTAAFALPEEVSQLVRDGLELGDADDQVFAQNNSKQGNGSVGLLTGDVVTRSSYYEEAVILALIPFKNKSLKFPTF